MTSQRLTNTTGKISEAASALRRQYAPSDITAAFPVDLQIVAIGACPTIDRCSEIQSPTLGVLSEAYSGRADKSGAVIENTAVAWMKGHLIAVSVFANVRDKMSDWQINAVCQQMLAENPEVTMMEFVLFCARLRSGMYEDFYGSVDPMRIIKSFGQFVKDKRNDCYRQREREDEERRLRESEEAKRNAISYDEWVRRLEAKGEKPKFLAHGKDTGKTRKKVRNGGNSKSDKNNPVNPCIFD